MTFQIRKLNKYLLPIISLTCVLAFWQFVTALNLVEPFFLPSPKAVFSALYNLFLNQSLHQDIGKSFARVFLGFFLAGLAGIPSGIAIGLSKKTENLLEPIIDFVRYTPISAFIPLIILWFGVGEGQKIFVIFIAVYFQIVLMVANSVSKTPVELIDSAKTLGAKGFRIISKVVFPYAQPNILDDLRINFGWAWSSLILAEIVGSTSGLGYVIIQSQRLLLTQNVIAVIIIVGVIGLLSDWAFKKAYSINFPWASKL